MSGENGNQHGARQAPGRPSRFTGLVKTIVDQGARTERARVRGQTITDVAAILTEARASGTLAMVDGDHARWTMTIMSPTVASRGVTEDPHG